MDNLLVSAELVRDSSLRIAESFEIEAEKADKFLARRGFIKCKMKEACGYLAYGEACEESGSWVKGKFKVIYIKKIRE